MKEYSRMFQDDLMKFFTDNNVKMFKVNEKTFIDKHGALSAIVNLCDEILQKGDINGTCFNIANYMKYVEANKIGFTLFENPTSVEMEYGQNWSFATTTIISNYFGFDIETIKQNNKDQFQRFLDLVDSLEVSAGIGKNTIRVSFSVNDVWRE